MARIQLPSSSGRASSRPTRFRRVGVWPLAAVLAYHSARSLPTARWLLRRAPCQLAHQFGVIALQSIWFRAALALGALPASGLPPSSPSGWASPPEPGSNCGRQRRERERPDSLRQGHRPAEPRPPCLDNSAPPAHGYQFEPVQRRDLHATPGLVVVSIPLALSSPFCSMAQSCFSASRTDMDALDPLPSAPLPRYRSHRSVGAGGRLRSHPRVATAPSASIPRNIRRPTPSPC